MREIKFRAWDTRYGEMKGNCPNLMLDLHGYLYWQFGFDEPRMVDQEQYTLMQYTGLKDRNGKEIYEGDIVRVGDSEDDPCATIHQVLYFAEDDYPAFDLKPYLVDDCNGLSHAMAEGYIEVIGNVHENPDLLEAKS